ncbi:beta-xylosidase [candidate division MSBL1 archaeon SCGC-AAA259A05]|uniref:Beta-xylosidase n=1 Tax=candidate division MSBL1 archaeon SCGC-AAA259A05 TaxID=1698259 RepID=A0A133UC01_9EURY|nr:beta-xylosidase [candidate division MSBL1 archaeon SCGC-AAA259A05]
MRGNSSPLYLNPEASVEARVEDLISRLSLEEKVAQLGSVESDKLLKDGEFSPEKAEKALSNGIGQITRIAGATGLNPKESAMVANQVQEFLVKNAPHSIPAMTHEECLSGYMGKGGTTYPQSIGMASTWDPNLMEKITKEIKKQLKAIGAHLALSPVSDMARDLRWGRVEETFGEDPYLVARMVTSYVKGLQGPEPKDGIYATLKHFGGHSVPEGGRNHSPVNISPRELRENFLFPFEATIKKAKAGSVMNAYHDIDGIPCAASEELLTDILRGEWEFDGIVVSDYFSIGMLYTDHKIAEDLQEAGIKAMEAGIDVELPKTNCYGEKLIEAVENGLISEAVIDEAVRRHLRAKFRKGIFEKRFVETDGVDSSFETEKQRKLAREAVRKSAVLLKNEGDLLPLNKNIDSVGVIGPNADSTRNLLGDYAYNAHLETEESAISIISILEGIKKKVSSDTEVMYAQGCSINGKSRDGLEEAVEIAKKSDLAIVVLGGKSGVGLVEPSSREKENAQTTGEGNDRTNLQLPGIQKELIKRMYETDVPVVVILVNGRPLATKWIAEHVPAILKTWLPGEEGGNGIADILFGDYCPSGKLPVSIPESVGQLPVHYRRKPISKERNYVFSRNEPLFPFGHGLSYTKFEYDKLKIKPKEINPASEFSVKVRIKNSGEREGDEIVQLYIRDEIASLTRPVKELKGFKRISLEPKESKTITFKLSADQLTFYDHNMNLVVEPGSFEVMLGSSSEDIRLSEKFEVTGEKRKVSGSRKYFTEVKVED